MSTSSAQSHEHEHYDDGRVHAHITPFNFLVGIFAALVVLTLITVGASYIDFGSGNTVIAILIATMKASLVAVFFMHLRHDKPFHAYVFVMAFVFLGIFLLLTLDDLGTRGQLDDSAGVAVLPRTGVDAPGSMGALDKANAPPAPAHPAETPAH